MDTTIAIRPTICWMIKRDMSQVNSIEQNSFNYPWSEQEFTDCLRQRNCIGLVAEHREQIVGYMIYELCKQKLNLLNFAVHPEYRYCGVGTAMVEKLIGKLSPDRRTKITLDIFEYNLDGQLFFKKMGFVATDTLRKYYDNIDADAYIMEYRYGIPELVF